MALFERLAGGDGWTVGRVGNSVFNSYRGAPSESLPAWFEAFDHVISLHPEGITSVTVFDERAEVPPTSVFHDVARRFRAYVPYTLAVVSVFEGSSVKASVKRTAVSIVQTILAPSYPVRTSRSLAEACDFISRYAVDDAGQPLAQPTLLMAFNAMRVTSGRV